MGIWRVLKATVLCDGCDKILAYLEFDAKDEPNIEHIRAWCPDCQEARNSGEPKR